MIKSLLKLLGFKSSTTIYAYTYQGDAEFKDPLENISLLSHFEAKNKHFFFRNEKAELDKWLSDGGECYGILSSEQVVAFSWIHYSGFRLVSNKFISFKNSYVWFGPDYVEPKARGQRLHKKLIENRLNVAKRKGYKGILTAVNNTNSSSVKNYRAFGFKPVLVIECRRFVNFNFVKVLRLNESMINEAGIDVK